MLDYFQILGINIDMKKNIDTLTAFPNSVSSSEHSIESSQIPHTVEIELRNEAVYKPPYHLYQYYQKSKTFQSQEAPMNYVIRIRNLREDSDKTQQEIADFLGTSQTMYARYERGANEMPIRHLIKLAQFYNVSLDYLCGLTSIKRPYPPI